MPTHSSRLNSVLPDLIERDSQERLDALLRDLAEWQEQVGSILQDFAFRLERLERRG